jgi:transketolase
MKAEAKSVREIEQHAKGIRRKVLTMNSRAGQGHTGGDLSEADILACLYFRVLGVGPNYLTNPDRHRFILSKGHGVGGFYSTLMEAGLLDEGLLDTYLKFDSLLPGHPVRQKNQYVEINTGGLGHGLAVGTGLALGAKKRGSPARVFVLTGDGELQEGSVWEAAMAAAQFKLDNLTVIVDRNGLQLADETEKIMALEPLADKWRAFGFHVVEIAGNDVASILGALEAAPLTGKPTAVIAKTTKGKGVSFIEGKPAWHHKIPVGDELGRAIEELE